MSGSRPIFEPGTLLRGTYQVVRPIGCGGMGQVFEARHTRLPGRLAIKALSAWAAPESAEWLRFRREAEIAASLRHPNIVQVMDFDQTPEGIPFLVMEFLDGHDLGAELRTSGTFSPERTVSVIEQVAAAVGAAHGLGIVHRDLKPQNVFLVASARQKGELAKVLDFGISKLRTAEPLTADSCLVGTPAYMSPEQARGLHDEVDGRTDQFALAAIAYEMLAGHSAFGGPDVPSTLFKVVHEEPPPLGSDLDGVLRRALSKDKSHRFLSTVEFAEALASAARAAGGAFGPGPAPRRPDSVPTLQAGTAAGIRRPAQGRSHLWWAAAGLAATASIAVVLTVSIRHAGQRAPAGASTPSVVTKNEPPSVVAPMRAAAAPVPPTAAPAASPAPARRAAARRNRPRTKDQALVVPPANEGATGGDQPVPPIPPRRRGSFIKDL